MLRPLTLPMRPKDSKGLLQSGCSSLTTIIIVGLVFVYAIFTRPLVFALYLPFALRVLIELIPLLLLILSFRKKFRQDIYFIYPLLIFSIVNFWANDATAHTSFLIFLKLAFFLLILDIFGKEFAVQKLMRKLLVNFWWIVSLSVIFAFILYWLYEPAFSFSPLIVNDAGDSYGYYNNPFLGNVRRIYMVGLVVPKPTWYFIEPGPLSCFFALNFVGASHLIADKKISGRFKYTNLVAGLCTLSVTFYIFLVLFFSFKVLRKANLVMKIFIGCLLIVFIYTSLNGGFDWLNIFFDEGTSKDDRMGRLNIFLDILSRYPEKTLLIGNGAELQNMGYDQGISSGWLVNFAERGLFFTIALLTYLIYKLRQNMAVLFVVVYYSNSFEFFAFPIFFVMLALFVMNEEVKYFDKAPRSIWSID